MYLMLLLLLGNKYEVRWSDNTVSCHFASVLQGWAYDKELESKDDKSKRPAATSLSSSKTKKSKTTTNASTTITGTASNKVDVDVDKTTKVKLNAGRTRVLGCANAVKHFDINLCNHIWCDAHDPTKSEDDTASSCRSRRKRDIGTTSVARRASASTDISCNHTCGKNCSVKCITDFDELRHVFKKADMRMTCKKEGCKIEFV